MVLFQRGGGAPAASSKAVDADGDFQKVGAEPEKPKTAKSIDDLFADDNAAKADTKRPDGAEEQPAAAKPPAEVQRTPEELKRLKDELRTNLDGRRRGYEVALGQGEVFFFGQRHNRVNGNYGTARALMGVLPKALREAQSPQGLQESLNRGGVYFADLGICTALFKNKNTFPLLEERLKRIEEDEELEALRRNRVQAR